MFFFKVFIVTANLMYARTHTVVLEQHAATTYTLSQHKEKYDNDYIWPNDARFIMSVRSVLRDSAAYDKMNSRNEPTIHSQFEINLQKQANGKDFLIESNKIMKILRQVTTNYRTPLIDSSSSGILTHPRPLSTIPVANNFDNMNKQLTKTMANMLRDSRYQDMHFHLHAAATTLNGILNIHDSDKGFKFPMQQEKQQNTLGVKLTSSNKDGNARINYQGEVYCLNDPCTNNNNNNNGNNFMGIVLQTEEDNILSKNPLKFLKQTSHFTQDSLLHEMPLRKYTMAVKNIEKYPTNIPTPYQKQNYITQASTNLGAFMYPSIYLQTPLYEETHFSSSQFGRDILPFGHEDQS